MLRGLEQFFIHNFGNRDGNPLVAGTPHLVRCLARVTIHNTCVSVIVRAAYVSLVAQQAPDRGNAPHGLPARGRYAVLVEPQSDLAHRQTVLYIVSKDTPHDHCFRLVDLQVRSPLGAARDAPIAVRAFPRDYFAGARTPEFAASISLGDLGAFVLGDHALHLREQMSLRVIIERGRVVEAHRHAVACQLVEHDYLISIHAGQAIWGQTPDGLKLPGFGGISQRVQTGPV